MAASRDETKGRGSPPGGQLPRTLTTLIRAPNFKAVKPPPHNVSLPVFCHRIVANFAAQSEGVTPDDITQRILETIPKDEKLAA